MAGTRPGGAAGPLGYPGRAGAIHSLGRRFGSRGRYRCCLLRSGGLVGRPELTLDNPGWHDLENILEQWYLYRVVSSDVPAATPLG
jgi:hypothetical protein